MSPTEWAHRLRPLVAHVGPPTDLETRPDTPILPTDHLELLRLLNGFTAYHGAFRLFGFRANHVLDITTWNHPPTWRFAWDDRLDPYQSFGETAFGDQYAYRRTTSGELEPQVYLLEGTLLRPEIIADSFGQFLVDEFLRNATNPYDEITVEAARRHGDISPNNHWVFVPSLALGGNESVENITVLPATTAMTFAGDIATAMRASRPGTSPTGVIPWTDESGRPRLRVTFG